MPLHWLSVFGGLRGESLSSYGVITRYYVSHNGHMRLHVEGRRALLEKH